MKILFVCKFNRFRSRVAEAYFNKINKKHQAKSAGIIKGRPLDKLQIKVAKNLGINIKGKPQGLSTKLLMWQDITIIVANDVPKEIFKDNKKYGKQLIVWKIPDVYSNNKKDIEKITKIIINKVEAFNKNLNKSKKQPNNL